MSVRRIAISRRASRDLPSRRTVCLPIQHMSCRPYASSSLHRRPISLRLYIYATTFTLVGLVTGQIFRYAYVPPAAPNPESPEDIVVLKQKEKDVDRLPVVQRFKEGAEWKELETYVGVGKNVFEHTDNPSGTFENEESNGWKYESRTITRMAMSGSRGLGVQRAFWNEERGELVTIVWFGQGLSGWPGVTHGGAIATVLEEGLRQVALGVDKDWTALLEEPNTLNLSYLKPTLANNFYLLRVTQSAEQVIEKDGIDPRKPEDRSLLTKEVDATLETLDGKTLVKARGTFTIPAIAQTKANLQKAVYSTWLAPLTNLVPRWST